LIDSLAQAIPTVDIDCRRHTYVTRNRARFGAHQFQEHLSDALVQTTWFSDGLRIIEAGSRHRNDVDARGLLCLLDRNQGLAILEDTGRS
jgi:hypothetical protein